MCNWYIGAYLKKYTEYQTIMAACMAVVMQHDMLLQAAHTW